MFLLAFFAVCQIQSIMCVIILYIAFSMNKKWEEGILFPAVPSHERLDTRCRFLLHAEGREGADNKSFYVSGMEGGLRGFLWLWQRCSSSGSALWMLVCTGGDGMEFWGRHHITRLGCGEHPRSRVSPVQGKCPWDSHALTSISKVLAPTVLLRTVEGFAAFACWEWSLNF